MTGASHFADSYLNSDFSPQFTCLFSFLLFFLNFQLLQVMHFVILFGIFSFKSLGEKTFISISILAHQKSPDILFSCRSLFIF